MFTLISFLGKTFSNETGLVQHCGSGDGRCEDNVACLSKVQRVLRGLCIEFSAEAFYSSTELKALLSLAANPATTGCQPSLC